MVVPLSQLSWSDCCDPSTQVSAMKYCDGGCTQSRLLIGQRTQNLPYDWPLRLQSSEK